MRDKLIELIKYGLLCPNMNTPFGGACDTCQYAEAPECDHARLADLLIANGVTFQQWIPVSEPPIEDGVYLCLFEDGSASSLLFETEQGEKGEFGFRQAYYDHDSLGYVDSEWWCADAVTHWMPLPEPPKEGG